MTPAVYGRIRGPGKFPPVRRCGFVGAGVCGLTREPELENRDGHDIVRKIGNRMSIVVE